MSLTRWLGLALLLGTWTPAVRGEELQWRPAAQSAFAGEQPIPGTAAPRPFSLGAPIPLSSSAKGPPSTAPVQQTSYQAQDRQPTYQDGMIIRAQGPAGVPPVPPPAFPGAGGSALGEEDYNCGNVLTPGPGAKTGPGGFWSNITNPAGRKFLESDHCFDAFCSPVTNPSHFEDPRALTELRPVFIWQRTPGDNPAFPGGDIYQLTLQGRVAFTDWFSVTIHQLGWTWLNGFGPGGNQSESGFSELHLGPKFTFLRNEKGGTFFGQTLMAAGLVFELPVGSGDVFQDTGTLSLRPYLSFGQAFGENPYGRFNFLATTGYSFAVDSDRSDHFFLSAHLDFDVGKLQRFYPFVELNYFAYTADGGARAFNFEGRDLANLGSQNVAGTNELSVAVGGRIKFTEMFQLGAAFELPLLGDPNLMDYRLTVDFIFRY